MSTPTLIHTHGPDRDLVTVADPDQDASCLVDDLNRAAAPGEWAAIPPAGSDWERADWDALAKRCGV